MKETPKYFIMISVTIYVIALFTVTVNRHYTFRTTGLDMGWFTQAIWSTSKGIGILYTTIAEHQICVKTHLGAHFSPILFSMVVFYKVFPHVETLLLLQALSLGISAYALFLVAEEILNDDVLSIGLVIMYLSNSLLHGINSYDFHATPFAVPFIFLAALYMERRNYIGLFFSALMILLVKEDAGLALISLALFHVLKDRRLMSYRTYTTLVKEFLKSSLPKSERMFILMLVGSLLWVLVSWRVIIPSITGFHMTSTVYYSGFPCLKYLPMKVLYFVVANLTLGFLTFLRPKYTFLLTFLPWIEILAGCEVNLFRIGFQYPYMVLPLSMISVVYTLKELRDRTEHREFWRIVSIGITVGLLFSILTTPILPLETGLKGALLVPADYYQPVTHHHRVLMEITGVLERSNFSILTQNDIFPHLANRINTYVIWGSYCGNPLPKTDIILLDNSLLYSVHSFAVEPYLVNYTKIYEYDGIEIWMRNDLINSSEARSLLKQLGGIK